MQTRNKITGLLGLAAKAGRTASGEFSAETAVKSGKAFLVLTALDASHNTQKKFRNMCEYRSIPIRSVLDKETMGKAIGKEFRAVTAVTDQNFAEALIKEIDRERS